MRSLDALLLCLASLLAAAPLVAGELSRDSIDIPAGHYRVGGERPQAYDNEVPPQQADLGPYAISRRPVSNAEYLAFMQDGGYQREELWQDGGWKWLQEFAVSSPDHWRQAENGDWIAIGINGVYDLAPDEPVDIFINQSKVAEGEVVVVDDHFGVRITKLLNTERLKRSG